MAHGLNSMIKREIDCSSSAAGIKSQVPQSAIVASSSIVSSNNSANSSGSGTGPCGNAKMGSRRIFTPQFKLQVLESYRNDSDCKGNQRATARKYGIHRRQIQKWLQCESNLRSSVANLSQSSMKHQFHNISHQMPIVPASTHHTGSHHHHHHNHNQQHNHHQQQYKASVLSLDTARHSVALTPMTLPAPPTTTAAGPPVAANSAAARLTTTKCVNGGSNQNHHGTTTMRPAATNTVAVSVGAQAVQVTAPAPAQPPPPPYRIAGVPDAAAALLTHTPALVPHYHHHHHHHHQHESRLLMPSASLPVPGSPVSAATNRTDELRDYQPIGVTGNRYMNEDYRNSPLYEGFNYYGGPAGGGAVSAPIDLSLGPRRRRDFDETSAAGGGMRLIGAMRPATTATMGPSSWQEVDSSDKNNNNRDDNYGEKKELMLLASPDSSSSHAVDLTCRKRKNATAAAGGVDEEATPEKVQKTNNDHEEEEEETEAGTVASSEGKDGEHHHHHQHQQQAKPVKLFKPYLLDENDQSKKSSTKCEHDPIIWSHHPTCITPGGYDSQASSTTTTASNNNNNNFPPSPSDRYPFPAGSPTFQTHSTAGAFDRATGTPSATPASPRTGATTYWCPKSSPVSGYDSASTYSDSSDYYRSPNHRLQTYSLDLKMQAIDSYYHDLTCRGDQIAVAGKYNVHKSEVQRWLDQETNIRQGIALYV